jgi:AraC-like DNA-binding protein
MAAEGSTPMWLFRRGLAGVRAMAEVAAERGVPVDTCLAGSGIEPSTLGDDTAQVRGGQELVVAHNLVHATGDPPGLGLAVGRRFRLRAYGVWGFALLASPTLRDAANVGLDHLPLTYATAGIRLQEGLGEVRLVLDDADVPRPVRRFVVEREVAAIRAILDSIAGVPPVPVRVDLNFPRPDRPGEYEVTVGGPVEFGTGRNAIIADATVLDRPLPQADRRTMLVCERECKALLASRFDGTVAAHVRDELTRGPGPVPDMVRVAAALHMSPRTLHRRLAVERTSYRRILDEVRQILAMELLTSARLGVEQVATRLGYADSAAFIRAFRRWTGQTPGRYAAVACDGVAATGRSRRRSAAGPPHARSRG